MEKYKKHYQFLIFQLMVVTIIILGITVVRFFDNKAYSDFIDSTKDMILFDSKTSFITDSENK